MTPTKEEMRRIASKIALFVRNSIEDMHAEGKCLTDDNMKEFNTNVRKSIYTFLLCSANMGNKQIQRMYEFFQPPTYWEEDCYDEVEKEIDSLLLLDSNQITKGFKK